MSNTATPADAASEIQRPDTFICITSNKDSAAELIKSSPLRFKFISEPLESIQEKASPGTKYVSVAAPIEMHELKDGTGQDHERLSRPESTLPDPIKTFKVHINPSNDYYDHKTTIRRNPLHGRWPQTLDEDQDSVYFALKNVVPDNIARKALCDWHTGGQLSEDAKILRASGGEIAKDWHILERQMRRKANLLVEESAEDELVAWTSVDMETWQRDQKVAGQRKAVNKQPVPGTAPGVMPDSNAQEPALSSGGDTLDAATGPAQPALALSEWQKLVGAAGERDEASRPALDRKTSNIEPRTVKIRSTSRELLESRARNSATPRQLRRNQFHLDQLQRERKKQLRSKQEPSHD